jgi:hypothetical protein
MIFAEIDVVADDLGEVPTGIESVRDPHLAVEYSFGNRQADRVLHCCSPQQKVVNYPEAPARTR